MEIAGRSGVDPESLAAQGIQDPFGEDRGIFRNKASWNGLISSVNGT
ncbi:MAG: hypothetical protein NC489_37760 [Ruminococcus flavefaciens]|nr:hypothetical protein [Ruminococcus flavefaciens]